MRTLTVRARLVVLVTGLYASAFIVPGTLVAQAQTPTAEQLQVFQQLPADQQQALLQRATGGANSGSATGSTSPRKTDDDAARRAQQQPVTTATDAQAAGLQADDVVLVEVELAKERVKIQPTGANSAPLITREPVEITEGLERTKLTALRDIIRARNPFTLSRSGQLLLPGFDPIALGGLSEAQATQRIAAEPALLKFEVKLTRLPVARSGVAGLKPFGYDLFEQATASYTPLTDVPVPADYVVGPGDELSVQLFGSQNRSLKLVVSREGTVSFPELGPIKVAGLRFSAAKAGIEGRVAQQMIGVKANVSMGDIRSIRIFVLGEAQRPGSYTVSGLATLTSGLFASGGIKPIGSLRDIQLKRQGAVVRHLDLYDLLIRGDTSNDASLLPGDVIFIPPLGNTVSIEGEVRRPALYELRGETTAAELLALAGGLGTEADANRAALTRVDEQSRRVVLDVNLATAAGRAQKLRNGDNLRVARLRPQIDSGVSLDGFVHRSGLQPWRAGLRISDVIGSVDELKPDADVHYVLIRRESGADRRVEVLSADLTAAWAARGTTVDVALQPRDRITVFDLAPGRERVIKPLLDELRLQGALARPTEVVRVEGRVKVPGEYPLEQGMRVADLLRAGGNLEAAAFGAQAELARYEVTTDGVRQAELITIDLAAVRRGEAAANVPLRPYDYLLVKETPYWATQEQVTLRGEVKFPGTYPIRRGETLRELIDRAGGLTPQGNPKGSVFTRIELREREQKQLDLLADRMQSDLATMSLQAAAANQAGAAQSVQAGQGLLAQLRQTKAVGRLVINLPAILQQGQGGPADITLRNGDTLIVPTASQEVTVIGEVQSATSHLYVQGLSRDAYIDKSGGTTRKADKRKIYIVRADGNVVADRSSIFSRSSTAGIQPGDTVVVPLDAERIPALPLWQSVTQILYNLTVALAAVKTF